MIDQGVPDLGLVFWGDLWDGNSFCGFLLGLPHASSDNVIDLWLKEFVEDPFDVFRHIISQAWVILNFFLFLFKYIKTVIERIGIENFLRNLEVPC